MYNVPTSFDLAKVFNRNPLGQLVEESCGLEWFHSNIYPEQPLKSNWKDDCRRRENLTVIPDHYIRCFCGAPEAENQVSWNWLILTPFVQYYTYLFIWTFIIPLAIILFSYGSIGSGRAWPYIFVTSYNCTFCTLQSCTNLQNAQLPTRPKWATRRVEGVVLARKAARTRRVNHSPTRNGPNACWRWLWRLSSPTSPAGRRFTFFIF